MSQRIHGAIVLLCMLCVGGCEAETLLTRKQLEISENGVYTDSGRFFVVGGDTLYEIEGDPASVRATDRWTRANCYFGGLVARGELLYTACMEKQPRRDGDFYATLYQFDPNDVHREQDVTAVLRHGRDKALFNGMDFGPDGALYLSDSHSPGSDRPAVIRVTFASERDLQIDEIGEFVAASPRGAPPGDGGGGYPNGIRFEGDTMYLSRGRDVVRTQLLGGLQRTPFEVIYDTGTSLAVVDDFDIAEGYLILAQTGLSPLENKLVLTDLDGNDPKSLVVPFMPSSIAARRNTLFGEASVIITSYFGGGLYRLDVAEDRR